MLVGRSCLVFLVLLAAVSACATSDYHDVQQRWTRSEKAYSGFETRALVHATLKTEAFRRAYSDEYARLFKLTPAQKTQLLEAELEEHERDHVIIVAFYTPIPAWNDLNPSGGFWEVRLQGSGGDWVHPHQVNRLKKRSPTYAAMYPYVTPHVTLYELRFDRLTTDGRPLAARGQDLELVIAGAPTQLVLAWKMP